MARLALTVTGSTVNGAPKATKKKSKDRQRRRCLGGAGPTHQFGVAYRIEAPACGDYIKLVS